MTILISNMILYFLWLHSADMCDSSLASVHLTVLETFDMILVFRESSLMEVP
jgi:hypothetical protein